MISLTVVTFDRNGDDHRERKFMNNKSSALTVFGVLLSTCKLDWTLSSSFFQYLARMSQTNISNFLPTLLTGNPYETKTGLFPEAMQTKAGQLDTNFREITTIVHVWTTFTSVAMWTLKKITRNIHTTNEENLSDRHCLPLMLGSNIYKSQWAPFQTQDMNF